MFIACLGCGYRPLGRVEPGAEMVRTVAVPAWVNRTAYRGVETLFTENCIQAITRRDLARVVPRAEAEAVLEGNIVSISERTVSFSAVPGTADQFVPVDYQIEVQVSVRLVRPADGQVLWELPVLKDYVYFDARSEPLKFEDSRRDALARLAEALARELANRWGGGF